MSSDTDSEIERIHLQVLRDMGQAGRARMTSNLMSSVRRLSEEGVRQRHPKYDARQVRLAAIRLAIGPELFRLAFPGEEVEP